MFNNGFEIWASSAMVQCTWQHGDTTAARLGKCIQHCMSAVFCCLGTVHAYVFLALGAVLLSCWALARAYRGVRHDCVSQSKQPDSATCTQKPESCDCCPDPLRFAFLPAKKVHLANSTKIAVSENANCITKAVALHRPTHEPWREKDAKYPYGWHFAGRRRLWEIRLQLQFKEPPQSQLYFGLMLGGYVPISFLQRQVQKNLVAACRALVGDFYHSPGDDPRCTDGELEPPTFVMPIWAFDQMVVSDIGEEPDLTGDLGRFGIKRTDGLSNYIRTVRAASATFRTDKVYTFCFWGLSKFLDCVNWDICGSFLPMRFNFNNLCGEPPIYIAMYEMPSVTSNHTDRRHLPSLKKYFFHVAMWSNFRPPSSDVLRQYESNDQNSKEHAQVNLRKQAPVVGSSCFCCPAFQYILKRDRGNECKT